MSTVPARREVPDRFMADIARLRAEQYVDSYAPIPA